MRNAGGSLTNKSVDEVMAATKKLAVREENTGCTCTASQHVSRLG